MAKDQTPSPGTHIPGPVRIESNDPAQTDFEDLPDSLDDQTAATADTDDFTLEQITDTSASDQSAAIGNNFATIAALLKRILERVQ